jgi:hypothetical protein
MTLILHSDGTGNRNVCRQFLDLLLADDQLLQAEFDAIVASEWDCAPPAKPASSGVCERSQGRPSCPGRVRSAPRAPNPPVRPGVGEWSRQRSPPSR